MGRKTKTMQHLSHSRPQDLKHTIFYLSLWIFSQRWNGNIWKYLLYYKNIVNQYLIFSESVSHAKFATVDFSSKMKCKYLVAWVARLPPSRFLTRHFHFILGQRKAWIKKLSFTWDQNLWVPKTRLNISLNVLFVNQGGWKGPSHIISYSKK